MIVTPVMFDRVGQCITTIVQRSGTVINTPRRVKVKHVVQTHDPLRHAHTRLSELSFPVSRCVV